MDTDTDTGFIAWVQAHTSSLTSPVTLCLCCLINEIVLTTTTCINQHRPTVLTSSPQIAVVQKRISCLQSSALEARRAVLHTVTQGPGLPFRLPRAVEPSRPGLLDRSTRGIGQGGYALRKLC